MGSTRSHPLPPGIFVQMPSPPLARSQPISAWYTEAESISVSNAFDEWTNKELDDEISRLQKRVKELESEKIKKRVERALVWDDDDDIMNDPDVCKMVENGEHICHMFDGECRACTMDEEDEEVQKDPEMTAHFC
jgi:regulator of replication initiation timing